MIKTFRLSCSIFIGMLCFGLFGNSASAQTLVGTGQTYTTLKSAFDAINSGTLSGAVVLQITSSITDNNTATLNASGTGSASYTSVSIYPTASGCTLSGSVNGPLIELNGADNVTIDGRVNITGITKSLTITNTNNGSSASTILFKESAESNTVKYCTVKGASTNTSGGVIFFSTSSSGNGNDGNTIDRNDITSDAAGRPVNVIFSQGTASYENSGNTISNNNIYNFFSASSASNGVSIGSNSTAWTISNNNFYETASFSATSSVDRRVISVSNSSGGNFTISGNYIGGNAASCSGTWTKTGSAGNFYAIYLAVGTTASNVQGNTIKSFSWTNSSSSNTYNWAGVYVTSGSVNIGTSSGNAIGNSTSTSSIYCSAGSRMKIYGIYANSTETIVCQNNTVGSIKVEDGASRITSAYGIYLDGSGTTTISSNTIGSASTANSIWVAQPLGEVNTANEVQGIFSSSTGSTTISGNTIANMNNDQGASEGYVLRINGIVCTAGSNTISSNIVSDLTTRNRNTNGNENSAVVGILLTGSGANNVSSNTICRLSNARASGSYNITIIGLYYTSTTSSSNTVNGNFIHSLFFSAVATSYTYGIKLNGGNVTVSNNIVVLDNNSKSIIYGIYEPGASGSTSNIYFNTIYIHGVPMSSTHNSYAFYCYNSGSTRNIRDNIFYNARTQRGTHYAIYFRVTGGTLTLDYNDYYVAETTFGYYGTNITSFSSWKSTTGKDANSLNVDPGFTNRGGVNAADYHTSAVLQGTSISGVTTDYYGSTRNNPPQMGAFEGYFRVWVGTTSTDFNTSTNWSSGVVPESGADIVFSSAAVRDCILDQDRTVGDISINKNTYKLQVNGKQLTIQRNINLTNSAKIDASAASSEVVMGGSSAQVIPSGAFTNGSVNKLTINNSSGVSSTGNLTIANLLMLTSGVYTVSSDTLSIAGSSPVCTSGSLKVSSSATLAFTGSSAVVLPATFFNGSVSNLLITGAGGVTASGNFTIDGVLSLNHANPSATVGLLNMGSYALTMGASATTVGAGDVSGTIKRSTFLPNVEYTFGNIFTSITLAAGGTMPTEISCKVTFGTAPSWKIDAINREYDITQYNGVNTLATIQLHYLDSELNSNDESKLVVWDYHDGVRTDEHGKATQDMTNNWVSVSNRNITYFNGQPCGLANKTAGDFTWQGSASSSWTDPNNWTGGVPDASSDVIIPDAATTSNDPAVPTLGASVKTMTIQSGGILVNPILTTLTVVGGAGAWRCNGTLTAAGTVVFTSSVATIAGATSFGNLTIADGATLTPEDSTTIRVSGALTLSGSAMLRAALLPNTIEYNGAAQTVIIPNGLTPGYWNLTISGTGVKTMPLTSMNVKKNFTLSGAVTVTLGADMNVGGNFTIDSDVNLALGSYSHTIGGNFISSVGISTSGGTITFNGTSPQKIECASASTFHNITIDNPSGVTLNSAGATTIGGDLTINPLKVFAVAPNRHLTMSGNIINNGGTSGLVLQSDATGTASLIHSTDNVLATVQRYMPGATEVFHFLSSPCRHQSFDASWFPPGTWGNGVGFDLYIWNEPKKCWYYLNTSNWNTVHPQKEAVPAHGYLYASQGVNYTRGFVGAMNNGPVSIAITKTSGTLEGFNLVGNPYPSAIDWAASSGWTRSDLLASGLGIDMWIWNPSSSNYGVYNSSDGDGEGTNGVGRFIASGQGFFVRASAASGSFGMDNSVRVHNSDPSIFKSGTVKRNTVNLTVKSSAGLGADEVMLRFGNERNMQGAAKLFSKVETAPSLYMIDGKENFSTYCYSTPESNPSVPVAFKAGENGLYTISVRCDEFHIPSLKLEDRKTHFIHDLRNGGPYKFKASKDDNPNRFVLHFAPQVPTPDKSMPAQVYAHERMLVVDLELVTGETNVEVFDLMGRKIMQGKVQGEAIHKLNLDAKTGVVIVVLKNPGGMLSQKVMWIRE